MENNFFQHFVGRCWLLQPCTIIKFKCVFVSRLSTFRLHVDECCKCVAACTCRDVDAVPDGCMRVKSMVCIWPDPDPDYSSSGNVQQQHESDKRPHT